VCTAVVSVTAALDYSLNNKPIVQQAVPVTPTPTPTYITCPSSWQCMLPGFAVSKWGTGGFQELSETPCGRTLIMATETMADEYCYQQNNQPILITTTPTPAITTPTPVPEIIVPPKIVAQPANIPAKKGVSEVVPAQKNVQGEQVVPANPQGNLPPVPLGQSGSGSSGVSSGFSGTTASAQPGLIDSFINFFANMFGLSTVKPPDLGPCGIRCENKTCCSGICIDTNSDPENCGSCGNLCRPKGLPCTDGVCGVNCAQGLSECREGDCVDLKTDTWNCGSCFNICRQGEICNNGKCFDLTSDVNNCGTYGTICPGGKNAACCSGTCVDTFTDSNNCAGCGNSCEDGWDCSQGKCNPNATTLEAMVMKLGIDTPPSGPQPINTSQLELERSEH
jgi:hypothetical protein